MIFYLVLIMAIAAGTGTSTILIKHNPNKTYLHSQLADGSMKIFPEKLQITIYLTKLPGLLFYGFYKTDDVVCILEERQIKLTFQGQHYSTSLQQLCKCDPCLYQPLTFTFQVNDVIQINCNGNEVVKNKLPSRMHGNLIHSFEHPSDNNNAHLYLINIPPYINHTYQYETLTGCIQEVKYKDISFINYLGPSDISSKCTPHCNVTTCNGGRCLETFDDPPLCDCQFAYKNGDYCNSELGPGFHANIKFQFQILKLTWNSSVDEILVVSTNRFQSIKVLHKAYALQVSFIGRKHDSTITIEKNYSPTDQHVMIISIDKPLVNIQYKSHKVGSWINMTTLLPDYLFHAEYSSVIFLNNRHSEKGDIVYKTHISDYTWLGFIENSKYGRHFQNSYKNLNIGRQLENSYKTLVEIAIALIVLCIAWGILIIAWAIIFIGNCRRDISDTKFGTAGGIINSSYGILSIAIGILYFTNINLSATIGILVLGILLGKIFIAMGILNIAKIKRVIYDTEFDVSLGTLSIASGMIFIIWGILDMTSTELNVIWGILFIVWGILGFTGGILLINPIRIKKFYKSWRKQQSTMLLEENEQREKSNKLILEGNEQREKSNKIILEGNEQREKSNKIILEGNEQREQPSMMLLEENEQREKSNTMLLEGNEQRLLPQEEYKI